MAVALAQLPSALHQMGRDNQIAVVTLSRAQGSTGRRERKDRIGRGRSDVLCSYFLPIKAFLLGGRRGPPETLEVSKTSRLRKFLKEKIHECSSRCCRSSLQLLGRASVTSKLLVSSVGSAEVQLFLAVTHAGMGLSVMQLPLNHLPSYQ